MEDTKILLILPFFYPHRGGSQKYAEEIFATLMKNHPNISVDVLCYNTDKTKHYEEYRNFRIYRIPCINIIPARFALPNPISLACMLKKLAKNKYRFVNTHIRFFDPAWWVWAYAKLIKAKSIFTGHVASHPIHQNKAVSLIAKLVDVTLAKASLRFYDYITFTNKTAKEFFEKKFGATKDTYIIYGGVDTTNFSPRQKNGTRNVPKTNIQIPPETTLITYVGRLIWTKGVTFLYDAVKLVLEKHPNATKIVLAGPGELEKKLRTQIKNDALEQSIYITGDLQYEEVQKLLAVSDIFVNPSHHNEGFPNTILEAGSCECLVIATDNAGTREVIRDYETGLLVPQKDSKSLAEAINWAIEHPAQSEELAKNLRQLLVQRFDWSKISDQLYDQILSKA